MSLEDQQKEIKAQIKIYEESLNTLKERLSIIDAQIKNK
jgi:hypothetical protein